MKSIFGYSVVFLLVLIGIGLSKNVSVSNVQITNINNGFCDITYFLDRPGDPISPTEPVWVFVKFKLSSEDNFKGWKDTDDADPSNDASDVNTLNRPNSVNANLTGDIGIVTSGGTKTIQWHFGGSGGIGNGTGLSPDAKVKVRVYVIEMALITGGNINFREDSGYTNSILTGTTTKCGNDYYVMRYPVTVEMYKDFLNAAANRHDNPAVIDSVYDYFTRNSYHGTLYNGSDLRNMLHSMDNRYGVLEVVGTVGVDAEWSVYAGDGLGNKRKNYPMNHLTWYNCYDFAAWCGLSMLEEEHFYKAASENGQSINYWGNTLPNPGICNYLESGIDGPSDVTQYEDSVNNVDGGPLFKVYEMAGNVWEWTATSGDNYIGNQVYDPSKGPLTYDDPGTYVIKKGCRWKHDKNQVYAARRYYGKKRVRYTPSGFRLGYFGGNQ